MYLNAPSTLVNAPRSRLDGAAWVLIALAFLSPFVLFFDTARSIVSIWNTSETFAHGYVILPIALWLAWRRRAVFDVMAPQPYWPALVLLLAAGAGWMLAGMGEVRVVQQFALAAMIPLVALSVFGPRLAKEFTFPLLFVLFAVPFGEVFIPPLIEFTADFTIRAVQLTGIPVLRNGTRFDLPSGSWSVVEACSGVRYLISSFTLGCLYAYLTYRSTRRRVIFIAFSIIVPIIANGLRAYMIVMIGHTSGMTMAVGVDHLIYGWAFFGIVMFVLFWVGSFWREDHLPEPVAAPSAAAARGPVPLAPIVAAVFAAMAVWPALGTYLDRAAHNPAPVVLEAPAVSWAPAEGFSAWRANFMQPDAAYSSVFRAPSAGVPVALDVLYYRNQTRDKALISSVNRMTASKDAFHEVGSSVRTEKVGERSIAVREARMRGPRGTFLVWHWMWIDGRTTTSAYAGKMWQAAAKVMMRGDDGAAVMLSAPYNDSPDEARAALRTFLSENYGAVEAALVKARGAQ